MKKLYFKYWLLLILFIPLLVNSQTGPGGVGNTSTNVLWLDASQLNLNNNDPVNSWTDRSGNGNNAVQTNTANQPTYLSSGFNNKPAIQFDGINDYLDLTTHISASGQSVFAVNQFGTPNGWTFLYTADQCDLMSNNGYNFGYYANGTFVSAGGYSVGDKKIISILVDNGNSTLQTGNNNTYTNQTYPGIFSKSQTVIGANYNGTSYIQFHSGIVPEIIVYNTRVNNAQKMIVNNYLASKYGLTIYNDFYIYDNTHPNEVAGILSWSGSTHTDSRGTSDIQINNPTGLDAGDYVFWGHDGGAYTESYDMPAGLNGSRWTKTWRNKNKGVVAYDLRVFIGTNAIGTNNNSYYLVYDDDGTFSNGGGGYFGPGVYDANTNSVLFSGIKLPDASWFTLANGSSGIESIASGNWSNPATWNCNCVPDSTNNVTIKNPHNVTVDTYSNVNSITVEAGATLTLGTTNTLSIKGNLENTGTFITNQGTLLFSGTQNQYITNNSSTINFDVYNYKQTNTGAVRLTQGNLRIYNNLDTKGYLYNIGPNIIVLMSTPTSTSYISPVSVANPFSGNFRLLRYISSRNAAWSDIASATSGGTFGHLDNKLYFSGIGGGDGNALDANGNIFYSAYAYNATTQAYDTVKSTSRVLNAGEGFEIWLATDETTYAGGSYYVNGLPNTGNVDAAAYLPANTGEWALLGNPYMSWIDWATVTRTNLDNTVWIYDAATANYLSYNNPQIPPMQGFWVQATGNAPSLTFTESSKIANNSGIFHRVAQPEEFAISLTENATGYAQTTSIHLTHHSKSSYEPGKDVTLLRSPNPKAITFTTISSDNKLLMKNYYPYQDDINIPLYANVKSSGIYTLSVKGLHLIEQDYDFIYIEDTYMHRYYFLNSPVELPLDEGVFSNRFVLHLTNDNPEVLSFNNHFIYLSGEQLQVKIDSHSSNVTVYIYSISGQLIAEYPNLSAGNHMLSGLPAGSYLIRYVDEQANVSVQKLIVP